MSKALWKAETARNWARLYCIGHRSSRRTLNPSAPPVLLSWRFNSWCTPWILRTHESSIVFLSWAGISHVIFFMLSSPYTLAHVNLLGPDLWLLHFEHPVLNYKCVCVWESVWKPEVTWYLSQLLSTLFFETMFLTEPWGCLLDEAGWLGGLPMSSNVCLSSVVIIGGHHC